ncbi:hypothetical protein [Paracoccus sp. (in: a-proteobacteria)]|uniref:hypothetical protein n=1 Tax=Paracoccus sp. TaxID=267 RepID=UPI00396CE966
MIGVVVWSSGPREKAIIWCEDQATLAYLQGYENLASSLNWPQPGDLVELETRTVGNLRHALNVSMLSEQGCPDLPRMLSEASPVQRQPHLRVVGGSESAVQYTQPSAPPEPQYYDLPLVGAAH